MTVKTFIENPNTKTLPGPGQNSTMLAEVTAESIIEKKDDQKEGRENGFIGISQPFCGNRLRREKARKRRIVNGETTTPGKSLWTISFGSKLKSD